MKTRLIFKDVAMNTFERVLDPFNLWAHVVPVIQDCHMRAP